MAKTVRLWEDVLKGLNSIAAGNNSSRSIGDMEDLISKLSSSSQQHKTAWKKLLKQMQLPRKLGLFASSKLLPDPGVTGTWLLPVFTEAVSTLLGAAQRDCMRSVQTEIFQQLASSGLFKTLDQLKAATAAQLEQSGAATTAAAAAAAAAAGGDLAALWHRAGALMGLQAHMNEMLNKDPSLEDSMPVESSSSSTAFTHQLLLASVKHISQYLQHDKQAAPPQDLVFMAYNLSVFATNKSAEVCGLTKQSPSALGTGGQHDAAWADISLLLLTYAWTLRLSAPENYAAVFGEGSSSSDAVAAPADSDARGRSAKSRATQFGPATGAAWQLAQSKWQHVPAAHEQQLGSFGISAQAGLWVAAIMSHLRLPSLDKCWTAVLHLSAGKQAACGAGAGSGADSAAELRVFWQAQASGIGRALEEYVRGEGSPQLPHVAEICSSMCESLARHGSSEQRLALFRLLVSLLKRSQDAALDPRGQVPTAVAKAAFDMLKHTPAARAVAGSVTPESDRQVVSGGLWLLVFGRCYLQWAGAVHRPMAAGKLKAALGIAKLSGGHDEDLARPWSGLEFGLMQQMVVVRQLEDWLGSAGKGMCAGLSAEGYAMGSVVEGARALGDTYGNMMQAVAGCVFGHAAYADVLTAKASGLVSELTSLGQALSVFAVRSCCNNPWCPNTSGMSEKAVVTGKSCLCAGCKVARYCCKTCQTACWESVHKPVCKMLRARSAAKA